MPADGEARDSDSVLHQATKIYAPFDSRETRRLRQYVADVEELVGSSFFSAGEKLTLTSELGGPLQTQLTYPGEEAVRAIVGLFRQLYNHHEPTSYRQILKLLTKHAGEKEGSLREQAVEELRGLRAWEKEALRPTVQLNMQTTGPDGAVVSAEELTPAVLIDLFLHGRYLHKGNEKSDKLNAWPLAHVAQHSFLGAIRSLSQVWWVGRNVVKEVLAEPRLLDQSAEGSCG